MSHNATLKQILKEQAKEIKPHISSGESLIMIREWAETSL